MTTAEALPHIPYHSLDQARILKYAEYLETYSDVIVQEKIHGSNISIVGVFLDGNWEWKLGSRKRWISDDEKFNNIQRLFSDNKQSFFNLFEELRDGKDVITIRLYGEVFGGQYGNEKVEGSIRTQAEPNYCADNDFAFFDLFVDGSYLPVLDMIQLVEKHGLKVAPVIFKGQIVDFFKDFDVNSFTSVVSERFYGKPYIPTPKGTEGVTIRTTNPDATGEEQTVLKFKQDWAVENRRVTNTVVKEKEAVSEKVHACLDMVNQNRFVSYASKVTVDELSNPRLFPQHLREIVEDTMKDVVDEFPPHLNPEIKFGAIRRKISQKVCNGFKEYLNQLETACLTPDQRLNRVKGQHDLLTVEVNFLSQRLSKLQNRLSVLPKKKK